ncbi:MAG: antibiotic biosynthesis monooxygenase, partial [Planctomycetota bacterium]
ETLVEGEPVHHTLHGLEAFFRDGGRTRGPKRWKMAVVTWLGVFPVVLLWSRLLPPLLRPMHPIVVTAVVTAVAVVTLAWLVMPTLTKCLAGWLNASSESNLS